MKANGELDALKRFALGKEPLASIRYDAGWTLEHVWMQCWRGKSLLPPEIESRFSVCQFHGLLIYKMNSQRGMLQNIYYSTHTHISSYKDLRCDM